MYAVRDATETVDSIPLITASILSKKMVEGLDGLVLDVKVGQGAFMRDRDKAEMLAASLVETASELGLNTVALITAMDEPLGRAVGNSLEVKETLELLYGGGSTDFRAITLSLGSEMLTLGGFAQNIGEARKMLEESISSGKAMEKFRDIVLAQGGDPAAIDRPSLLPSAPFVLRHEADYEGYVAGIDAFEVGQAAFRLGAGRVKAGDSVDPSVGVVLHKKVGEQVKKGELLFEVHARDKIQCESCKDNVLSAYRLSAEGITHDRWVLGRIGGGL